MSIFVWLPLLFAAPPTNNTCSTRGVPLLEMQQGSDTSSVTTTTKIFASGAWTVTSGKRMERGCFDPSELRAIRSAVQRAPWTVTTSPIACFAYDPNFVTYAVRGKHRYTARMCSGQTADAQTLRAIELVNRELADERKPTTQPPPPPPAPPIARCGTDGTPMFELTRREDGTAATTSIAIYSTGGYTVATTDSSGTASLTKRCFDRKTAASVQAAVTAAPWETTYTRIVCKAYSPSYTQYFVNGTLEHTARLCSHERIDDKSRAAIDLVEAALRDAG